MHPVARKVQSKEGLEHEQVLRVEHAEDDEEPSSGRSVYDHVEDSAVLRGCTGVSVEDDESERLRRGAS